MHLRESEFENQFLTLIFCASEISAALWVHIHFFEITLRNSLHRCLSRNFLNNDWASIPNFLSKHHTKLLLQSKKRYREGNLNFSSNIGCLTLSFWVELLNRRYHNKVWTHFKNELTNYSGEREDFYNKAREIRNLRNAIAHHGPILRRNLMRDYAYLHELTTLLNPQLADEVQKRSRVLDLLLNARLVGSGGGI